MCIHLFIQLNLSFALVNRNETGIRKSDYEIFYNELPVILVLNKEGLFKLNGISNE
jgi:hypothetical protein